MVEVIGIVEQGQIKLPPTVHLSEGQSVRVLLDGLENAYPLPPLEDEEWTEEEMRVEVASAQSNGYEVLTGNGRPRESDPAYLLSLPKAERNRIMEAQATLAAPLYEADLALPVAERELTAFTALDGDPILEDYHAG